MSLDFTQFYKQFGVRQATHLMNPPVFEKKRFTAPKLSLVHCVPVDEFQTAPDMSDLIYNNNDMALYLHHVLELSSQAGKPRHQPFNHSVAVRSVFIGNKRFRRLDEVGSRDKQLSEISTVSYCFAPKAYIYIRSAYREYYKWYNLNKTMTDTMAAMMASTGRNHFLHIPIDGEVFPSKTSLDLAATADAPSLKTVSLMTTHAKCWLLEIWKWLGEDPSKSILGVIKSEHLGRVNLVFSCADYFVTVNLGRLKAWKKASKEDIARDPKLKGRGFDAAMYQKYFFVMLLKLQTHGQTLIDASPVNDSKAKFTSEKGAKTPNNVTESVDKGLDRSRPGAQGSGDVFAKQTMIDGMNDVDDHDVHEDQLQAFNKDVDDDLEAIDTINQPDEGAPEPEEIQDMSGDDDDDASNSDALINAVDVESSASESDISEIAVTKKSDMTPAQAAIAACDAAAAAGSLSGPTYRAYVDLASRYTKIKAPDGKSTLADFVQIKPEHMEVKPTKVLGDRRTILDDSLTHSTLLNFDKQYIEHIHQRNVVAMVLGAQYGRVIITDFQHERIEDVAGEYDTYCVKLQPIDGSPSTINMKMPAIHEDGTFFANGVTYRMRKQQFDLPIRKVSPVRVALTSYYGKVFVDRSERKASNYTAWIGNQLMDKALNDSNSPVKVVNGGEGFDPSLDMPLVYSALGMRYISFGYNEFIVYLSRKEIHKTIAPEVLKQYETNGTIVVGWDGGKRYMLLDKNSVWYTAEDSKVEPLGTIEAMLGIDPRKAPVPYATVKVFGQDIPMGVVYAYMVGMDSLMRMLKIKPKRIIVGTRYSLEENEFSIVFADEALVFNRENTFASLILAGFNEYHKHLRLYRYHDFNKKAVYANVLESAGLSVRYLREIVLMDDMFIDPVTKQVLTQMKEPTTFRGLLARAVQYLCTDAHPDEIDTAFMRFKGYERFSGAIWAEMVKSMRVQRSKATRASRVVEMNPYAVWKTIMTDASVLPVKEINPIEYTKDVASVTFSGTGGRSGRTMVKRTRRYHPSSMGTTSGDSVDSGDVGVNIYMSMNPQLDNVSGTTTRYDPQKTGTSSMLSVSAMLAPAADKDD